MQQTLNVIIGLNNQKNIIHFEYKNIIYYYFPTFIHHNTSSLSVMQYTEFCSMTGKLT